MLIDYVCSGGEVRPGGLSPPPVIFIINKIGPTAQPYKISKRRSEEVGLSHDAHELVFVDLTVTVSVGFVDHFLDLLVGHVLTKLLGNTTEVMEVNLTSIIIVEESEGLHHLFTGVSLGHFLGHHIQEFWEINNTTAIAVGISDHLADLLFLWLETESSHGNFEFFSINGTTAISIEEIKGLLDFLFLLLSELGSLLWSSEGRLLVVGCHFKFLFVYLFIYNLNRKRFIW